MIEPPVEKKSRRDLIWVETTINMIMPSLKERVRRRGSRFSTNISCLRHAGTC
jgi:hypothetical protein